MKKILTIFSLLLITSISFAQINSLYFNKNIFQSTELNPARQNTCRVYIGLPALSSLYLNLNHTGFAYSDIFIDNETELLWNVEGLYNTLDPKNHLFVQNKTNLLFFSFVVRDFYITFDANLNLQQNFTYPKSLMDIKDGNYFEDGRYISFTGLNEDFTLYNSYSIGVSKEVAPGLLIGGKFKLLKGLVNVYTKQFMFDWKVSTADEDIYDYIFTTSFDIRASAPFNIFTPEYDDDGNIVGASTGSDAYFDALQDKPVGDLVKEALLPNNNGFAFDFGAIYNLNDKFEFSASIIDLGFINWKSHPMIVSTEKSDFEFAGFDAAKYINNISIATSLQDSTIRDSIINMVITDFVDTLILLSNPTFDSTAYKKNLNAHMHFGVAYSPTDAISLGFLYNGYFYNKELFSTYMLSSTFMFWKGWSYTLSYTMMKKSMNNLGMGFSYKIGFFQMYLLMENISVPSLAARYGIFPEKPYNEGIATKWVKNTQNLNLHFGINFVFGCKNKQDFGVLD